MFMPNIAATKEYTDKQRVPEQRKSSSCNNMKKIHEQTEIRNTLSGMKHSKDKRLDL